MAKGFDRRTLLGVLLPDLDAYLDRLLTSPSRDLFAAPPESVHLLVVGGAAMMTYRPERMTTDIDSITALHRAVITAAQTVAAEHGLRRDWLNDQTAHLVPAPAHIDTVFQGRRITVSHPGAGYLLATKIVAGRPRDIEDAAALIASTGHDSVDALCGLVAEVYGTSDPVRDVRDRADQAIRYYWTA